MTARAASALLATLLLAGCGVSDPNAMSAPVSRPAAPPAPTGLRTPTPGVAGVGEGLVDVAVDYALTQATWSPDTYVSQRARLADMATGPALAQLTPRDGQPPAAIAAQLRAAGSSSRAVLLGSDHPPRSQRVIVATKVIATGRGRDADHADYAIAHLSLVRSGGAWRVLTFQIAP